jgi:acyl-CoA reductase-like NAD-dependent aldehyde dehydrogenase
MSGADHRRPTVRLDRDDLDALVKKAEQADAPAAPRTLTVEDPLTTQLLAEVARRTRTIDIDDEADEATNLAAAETPHPHTRRRPR